VSAGAGKTSSKEGGSAAGAFDGSAGGKTIAADKNIASQRRGKKKKRRPRSPFLFTNDAMKSTAAAGTDHENLLGKRRFGFTEI
jgi:hypothetical protein